MTSLHVRPSLLLAAALSSAPILFNAAQAEEPGRVVRVASRCDIYGNGVVELGNGACGIGTVGGQSGLRVRIEPGPQPASAGAWTMNGTSNAALRNDGTGMLPGISDARHLRIQGGADPYGR